MLLHASGTMMMMMIVTTVLLLLQTTAHLTRDLQQLLTVHWVTCSRTLRDDDSASFPHIHSLL